MTQRYVRFAVIDKPDVLLAAPTRWVQFDRDTKRTTTWYAAGNAPRTRCIHDPITFEDTLQRVMNWIDLGLGILPGWPDDLRTCIEIERTTGAACQHTPSATYDIEQYEAAFLNREPNDA